MEETEKIISVIMAGIHARMSIMLVGNPGQGKSALIRGIADSMDYGFISIIGSQRDSTDITGFPVKREITDDDGGTHLVGDYAIPYWQYRILTIRKVILFLDEYSNSPPPVQASMLALLNEREFPNGDKVPDETVIIGAMNPVDTAANGFELGLPVSNRLMMIPWNPTMRSWLDGFTNDWGHGVPKREVKWRALIAEFLKRNPYLLYKLPDSEMKSNPAVYGISTNVERDIYKSAYPTNRSWTNLARVIPYCVNKNGNISKTIMEKAAQGIIGYEAASKFMGFIDETLNHKTALPPTNDIIASPSSIDWSRLDAGTARQVISGMMSMAHDDRNMIHGVANAFIFIAGNRGTDICAPYVTELIKLASSYHLTEDTKALMTAYKSIGSMIS